MCYELFDRSLKDVTYYEPIKYKDTYRILMTDYFGRKYFDHEFGKVYELSREELAQEYCNDMMSMVNELNRIKKLDIGIDFSNFEEAKEYLKTHEYPIKLVKELYQKKVKEVL